MVKIENLRCKYCGGPMESREIFMGYYSEPNFDVYRCADFENCSEIYNKEERQNDWNGNWKDDYSDIIIK